VHGALHLHFRATARNEQPLTMVDTLMQTPPLQVVRSFRLADGGALVHLHNVSGGVLGGDRLQTTIDIAAGARAQLTTTGATRIYRRRAGHGAAEQALSAHVGPGALLEYLPDPVIPYAGSAYRQRTRFVLAEGAGLFAWDVMAPGREARGESFAYDQLAWETAVEVVTGGEVTPIALERACLEPAQRPLTAPARMGPFGYLATMHLCQVGVAAANWQTLERALHDVAAAHTASQASWWGVSTLVAHGVVVRGLATAGRPLLAALPEYWRVAKRILYDEAALPPRKVY
jgi:urease accessory protein